MAKYDFHIVDVFSRLAFGGNQLAVLTDASGISAEGMQKIAREFNFAESTFVLPPLDARNTCRVRIFTPKAELPFAGHPTVGTAGVLARSGLYGAAPGKAMVFEEGVGPVAVMVEDHVDAYRATLTLPGTVEEHPVDRPHHELATVLSLGPDDVKGAFFASAGVKFCFIHLASRDAVDRAAIDRAAWTRHLAGAWSPHLFLFAGEIASGAELHARMFAPALGIDEDPATGGAAAALVGALAARTEFQGTEFRLTISQGVAMGRPSTIEAYARKEHGVLASISVGGATTPLATGQIEVPDRYLEGWKTQSGGATEPGRTSAQTGDGHHISVTEGAAVGMLPLRPGEGERAESVTGVGVSSVNLGARTIVIVDDVRFTRTTLVKMLTGIGSPALHEAEDGEGALKLLGQLGSTVDCVITDLEMPRLDGLGLLQAIRVGTGAIPRDLPVVILTGHSEFERMGAALLLDVDAFITKPVSKAAIEDRLAKVLGQERAGHRLLAAPHVYRRVDLSGASIAAEPPEAEDGVTERNIPLAEIADGALLARDLMFSNGRLLLPAHTRLNARTVQLLHEVASVSGLPGEVWVVG